MLAAMIHVTERKGREYREVEVIKGTVIKKCRLQKGTANRKVKVTGSNR